MGMLKILQTMFTCRSLERELTKADSKITTLEKQITDLHVRLKECEKQREILNNSLHNKYSGYGITIDAESTFKRRMFPNDKF